jgi:hypothetical protein
MNLPNNSSDETKRVEKMRKEIYQSMTATQKWQAAADLYYTALHLKEAHLQQLHPDWSRQDVEKKAREWMLYART